MPNIKSAKKRVLVIEKKTLKNKAIKSALKDYYDKNGIPYEKNLFPDCANCGHCHA